jgi:hypothetical protein
MEQTPVPQAFDFTAYEDTDSADVRIKDPKTGAATSMVVQLAGPEHPARKRITLARQRKMRQVLSRTGKLPMSDPEDDEADQVDLLVASTIGWTGAATPFSTKAATDLYNDPKRRWLRDQVQTALDDRELFTRSSAAH